MLIMRSGRQYNLWSRASHFSLVELLDRYYMEPSGVLDWMYELISHILFVDSIV